MGLFSNLLSNAGLGLAAYDQGQTEGQIQKAKLKDADRRRKIEEAQLAIAQQNADTNRQKADDPNAATLGFYKLLFPNATEKPNGWTYAGHHYDTEAEYRAARGADAEQGAAIGERHRAPRNPPKDPYNAAAFDNQVSKTVQDLVTKHGSASGALKAIEQYRMNHPERAPNMMGLEAEKKLRSMALSQSTMSGIQLAPKQ